MNLKTGHTGVNSCAHTDYASLHTLPWHLWPSSDYVLLLLFVCFVSFVVEFAKAAVLPTLYIASSFIP